MAKPEITAEDGKRIAQAIHAAERKTSGEIIAVAARQSDDYIHVPLHIAAAVALGVPFVMPLVARLLPWSTVSMATVFLVQLIAFIVVALVLRIDALRYVVTPKSLMKKYARRNAAFQFLAVNTHTTHRRTGVLLFVSLLERHAEVIADAGIAGKVKDAEWQAVIDGMLPLLKEGRLADAMTQGVEQCGALLAHHFPPQAGESNELPDHFVFIT
jgi:putative membrane protein